MAKKKDNTLSIILMLLGGYLLINQRNQVQPYPYYNYPTVPQQPQTNNLTEFQQWVTFILSLVGPVASLWQPGGPFYNLSQNDKDQIAAIYAAMGYQIPT